VVISDTQGRIEWANEGFTRMTGYALAEVRGRSPALFSKGQLTDQAKVAEMRHGLRSGAGFKVEIITSQSGEPYWIEISKSSRCAMKQAALRLMAIESDISERKGHRQRLVANEQRLSDLTDHAPGVFFQFEIAPDGRPFVSIMECGFSRGVRSRPPPRSSANPSRLFASVHESGAAAIYTSLNQAIRADRPVVLQFSHPISRWRRTLDRCAFHGVPAIPMAPKVWVGVLTDITELQQARYSRRN